MDDLIATTAEAEENRAGAAMRLPHLHEVHTDPDEASACEADLPPALRRPPEEKSPARWAYERLILYIKNFEKTLDPSQEIAMGFAGGNAGVIRIGGLGYFDPDIVTFYGTDEDGARTQLIQHVTQLGVLLRAVPKPAGQEEPNRIGFRLARDLEDAGGETEPIATT